MKDVYDLWRIFTTFDIETEELRDSITRTFERRLTALEKSPVFLSEDFWGDEAKQQQWRAFLNRSSLEAPSLQATCHVVAGALTPVLAAALGSTKGERGTREG